MKVNTHQLRPRGIGVGLQILYDVPVVAPVVDESELEYRGIDAMKWENILMSQSLPDRYQLPKGLLRFMEVLGAVGTKGFEGNLPAVPSPLPNVGDPS